MARTKRNLLAVALATALPVLSASGPTAAEPTDTFGEVLDSQAELPGLRVTEVTVQADRAQYESVRVLADRHLLIVATGPTFVVFDSRDFRVIHEETMSGVVNSIDVSDDGTTLVVSVGSDDLHWFETSLWGETRHVPIPASATPAGSVRFAPGSTDIVLTLTDGLFSVIDGATPSVLVPEYDWGANHAGDLDDAIWGLDSDTLLVASGTTLHEVDVATGTPSTDRTLALPRSSTDVSLKPLYPVGDLIHSEWGFAVDPATWTVDEVWDLGVVRSGRSGSDTVIIRSGADVEFVQSGEPTLKFEMPEPFGSEGNWLLPLAGTEFVYTEAGEHLRFGDAGFLASASGDYTAVTPERAFDTRVPIGQPDVLPLGAAESRDVKIAGVAGVPAEGAAAVVVNVTAVNATEPTFVSVFPSDGEVPNVSTVNLDTETARPGAAVANLATVRLGVDGSVTVFNGKGSVDVILDVMGFYSAGDGPSGARFVPLDEPRRIADTRRVFGSLGGAFGPDTTKVLDLGGELGDAANAAVLQITAIQPSAYSFVTVWPGDVGRPNVSNINLLPGRTSPNLAIVRVPDDGVVNVYNLAGGVDVAVDLVGYFEVRDVDHTDQAGRFLPFTPWRLSDTRVSSPYEGGALPPFSELVFPSIGATAETGPVAEFGDGWTLVTNLTAVSPTEPGFLAAIPTDATNTDVSKPTTSNVNFMPGQVRPNHAFVTAAPHWSVYNSHGYTHVLVDVFGFITPQQPTTSIPDFGD